MIELGKYRHFKGNEYEVLHIEELHFETKTSRQFSKYVIDNSKKYYVLVYAKSAPFYYLDLRGH